MPQQAAEGKLTNFAYNPINSCYNKKMNRDEILQNVRQPARYVGNELNSIHKDWGKTPIKIALSYPDTYEIGMSNLAIQILYYILNKEADVLAERVFAPWPDYNEQLTTNNLQLTSLESLKPLSEFDLIGFGVGHELTYTNLINILHLGGVPIYSKDRTNKDPLVMAGGPCTYNPAPIADFVDFFVIGEAEEVLLEIVEVMRKSKMENRKSKIGALAQIDSVYVPGISQNVKKRSIKDLSNVPYPLKPIVPFLEAVHDRATLEIMRGCKWGCKFCQAGATGNPVRSKKIEVLLEQAEALLKNTGYEEISLISLSSSDHPQIAELAKTLAKKYAPKRINIALPSMRTNSFSIGLAKEVSRVRPSGITIAPEAGTQRLRDVIGKNMTEEDILDGVKAAFNGGIESIKLYFMVGLPTETEADIMAIGELANKILNLGRSITNRARVTVNLSTFIPKPHTLLEREKQISIEETIAKHNLIKQNIQNRRIEVRWHQAEASFLEGVFARGDRQLSKVVEKAWELGCRLDAWSEHLKIDLWLEAFKDCGIEPKDYLRKREENEPLPWGYIDTV
ncbi:B12-binding domain-containing radical SAM protein [Candidatus Saganbacteria bacterium CG08_land_8_20_14_0_20_45_16]|uniref:B12-binding domain-containing radical SAM protein n=1 Tax=Candidatus Saganbacteria bacterium CG08_land_8_20_14_0_20_45_16 TaxID=2014293 RepID=A0A2H0Y1F7_UNCSA|nr:MAG: B12-binding domain-containing radical SAM protein [Candidatus Saganbacteria bacterium CG08_land_8_20_14_0_20_45_16]